MARLLYYTTGSPYARKVRIFLLEKNLSCELIETDLIHKSPEFLKIAPLGKVPLLIDEDGTKLWDSTLIVEYLEETYPGPSFYPSDRQDRLQCRQWNAFGDELTNHAVVLWYGRDESVKPKHHAAIERLLALLDEHLSHSAYLVGDTWTVADISVMSALGYYTFRFGEQWQQQYPRVGEWFQRLHERESVKLTIPR